MFTAIIPFAALGKNYEGETEALIYQFKKDKIINDTARDWLESKDDIEASVSMQYVKLSLAMNSDNENDKEEKAEFVKYYDSIANKNDFEEIPYFFAIKEAKNVFESSLVPRASNHVTGPIIEEKSYSSKEVAEMFDTFVESIKENANESEHKSLETKLKSFKESISKGEIPEPQQKTPDQGPSSTQVGNSFFDLFE